MLIFQNWWGAKELGTSSYASLCVHSHNQKASQILLSAQSAFSLVLKAGVVATRKSGFHPHVPVNKLLSHLFPWFPPVSPWLGLSHGYLFPHEAIPVQEHYISIWGLCFPGASAHVLRVQRCLRPQRLGVHGQLHQVSHELGFFQLSSI